MAAPRRNPLLYTAEGHLDLGPLALALACGVGLAMFVLDGLGWAKISVAAYSWLGAYTSLAFIAGAAEKRAYWIARSRTPGEVARGIAESLDTPQDAETLVVRADD